MPSQWAWSLVGEASTQAMHEDFEPHARAWRSGRRMKIHNLAKPQCLRIRRVKTQLLLHMEIGITPAPLIVTITRYLAELISRDDPSFSNPDSILTETTDRN